jgi:hypothetical protein
LEQFLLEEVAVVVLEQEQQPVELRIHRQEELLQPSVDLVLFMHKMVALVKIIHVTA